MDEKSDVVYCVNWSNGEPRIVRGHTVVVGDKRKSRRVKTDCHPKLRPLNEWHATIDDAIRNEVVRCAHICIPNPFIAAHRNRRPRPLSLIRLCGKLNKLRRNLQKRGLVESEASA